MTTRRRWISHTLLSTLLVAGTFALTPTKAEAKEGFYLGLGLGYASVSGDTGIGLQKPHLDPDNVVGGNYGELVRSDGGSGFAFDFRMGYNILGVVAVEFNFGGSGNNISNGDEVEGQAGAFLLVKTFPFQFAEKFKDRFWDPYLYGGGGVYFMGYHPDAHPPYEMTNDGRAWWPSIGWKYGLGCDFYVGPFMSLGVDFGFIHGFHSTFHIDYDDNTKSETQDSGSSFAFQSTVKINFHFPGT